MSRPTLLVLATGGTIAGEAASSVLTQGYTPGARSVSRLLEAVPELTDLASVRAEQPFSIGSQHISTAHWLQLAARVRTALADPEINGIVIAHGTDTMEETAFFLDMVCERRKAIVLTGAMRPATALSADGPMNLYSAARVATDPLAQGAGVLVVMNDQVLAAHQACKAHTLRTDAFMAREGAALATLVDARARWRGDPGVHARARPTLTTQLATLPATLPRVDLLAQQVDIDPMLVVWLLERGARGIVVAGTGHGSLSTPLQAALAEAARSGCLVIRASRVSHGPVIRNGAVDDDALGFVASGSLSPHAARALTSLAVAAGLDRAALQALFDGF